MSSRRRKGRKAARRSTRKTARRSTRKAARPKRRAARSGPRAKRKRASAARAAKPKRASAGKAAKAKRGPARRAVKPKRASTGRNATRTPASTAGTAEPKRAPAQGRARPAGTSPAPRGERLAAGVPVEVGVVLHWYPRASAAVVELSRPIHVGDTIHVRGHSTDFVQQVASLALEGAPVRDGAPPQALGVRLEAPARPGDRVYRVSW